MDALNRFVTRVLLLPILFIEINLSVPQGSILGPLLFSIYVNDFPTCLKYGTSLSFADDANIFISGKTAQTLFDKGNDELGNIDNWLVANKLSLNANKTKCVYFYTANSKTPPSDLNLFSNKKHSN